MVVSFEGVTMELNVVGVQGVGRLGDVELIAGLRRLVQSDRVLTARLLVHLGEVDARGLYREHAFDSMFSYAVAVLHMSESEAYLRIQAARLGREFPLVLDMLSKGELHLTAIKLLGPHVTRGNHAHVLAQARFKGKREIELIVAELAPKPDVPSIVRKLPERVAARPKQVLSSVVAPTRQASGASQLEEAVSTTPQLQHSGAPTQPWAAVSTTQVLQLFGAPTQLGAAALVTPQHRSGASIQIGAAAVTPEQRRSDALTQLKTDVSVTPQLDRSDAPMQLIAADESTLLSATVASLGEPLVDATTQERDPGLFELKTYPPSTSSTTPLSPGRYRVKFTTGQAMHDTLDRLKNLLRHQVPDGDIGIILERAAELLLEKTLKERFAQTTKRTASRSRASAARSTQPRQAAEKASSPTAASSSEETTDGSLRSDRATRSGNRSRPKAADSELGAETPSSREMTSTGHATGLELEAENALSVAVTSSVQSHLDLGSYVTTTPILRSGAPGTELGLQRERRGRVRRRLVRKRLSRVRDTCRAR
jgi:hypothetical protein